MVLILTIILANYSYNYEVGYGKKSLQINEKWVTFNILKYVSMIVVSLLNFGYVVRVIIHILPN